MSLYGEASRQPGACGSQPDVVTPKNQPVSSSCSHSTSGGGGGGEKGGGGGHRSTRADDVLFLYRSKKPFPLSVCSPASEIEPKPLRLIPTYSFCPINAKHSVCFKELEA